MKGDYAALSYISLQSEVTFDRPPQLPEIVHLDDPAEWVMTDFRVVQPRTVRPDTSIGEALESMKTEGVRLLLVTDVTDHVLGVVTANDIQGEKPVKIVEENRAARADITVEMVMTPQSEIEVLNFLSIRNARVGHIVETMREVERQHMLIVEVNDETRRQTLRGLFSTSQIGKQLGASVAEELPPAHSLAEMQQELG